MFDRIDVHPTRDVTKHVEVHEHRAPTDASIKLYDELLAKARAEILETTVNGIPGNTLSHVKVAVQRMFDTGNTKYEFWFQLNGVAHRIEFNAGDFDSLAVDIAKEIFKKFTEGFAGQVLNASLPRLKR